MSYLSISSAKLSLTGFLFFTFISCKNSPSGQVTVNDSIKNKDTAIMPVKKLPGKIYAPPVLLIGKGIDYKNQTVQGSSIFTREDTLFVYYLLNHKKFDLTHLNLRFYKVQEKEVNLLESVILDVDPEGNAVSDSFELYKVYDEFGDGQFEMQFLHQDSIIASESFILL